MDSALTKQALLDNMRAERANFEAALDGLSGDQLTTPGVETNWSVRDVVAHVLFWEKRALFLLKAARDGYREEDDFYKLSTVDEHNARNYEDQKNRPAQDVIDEEKSVYQEALKIIEATPAADLVTASRFEWLRYDTLIENLAGETFEHYRDHLDALKAWRHKALGE